MDSYPFHAESRSRIRASAERVFAHLDDHSRLSAHMERRSWRMGWGRMDLRLDERAGRAVGSHIQLEGRAFGLRLALDEVVTEYAPPAHKVWETVGTPHLLVIGPYRMGFRIEPADAGGDLAGSDDVTLTVFVDYALPERGASRLLGRLFGHAYARWCCTRMVDDARAGLEPGPAAATSREGRVLGT
jgi:hypothetical protein